MTRSVHTEGGAGQNIEPLEKDGRDPFSPNDLAASSKMAGLDSESVWSVHVVLDILEIQARI